MIDLIYIARERFMISTGKYPEVITINSIDLQVLFDDNIGIIENITFFGMAIKKSDDVQIGKFYLSSEILNK